MVWSSIGLLECMRLRFTKRPIRFVQGGPARIVNPRIVWNDSSQADLTPKSIYKMSKCHCHRPPDPETFWQPANVASQSPRFSQCQNVTAEIRSWWEWKELDFMESLFSRYTQPFKLILIDLNQGRCEQRRKGFLMLSKRGLVGVFKTM